MCSRHSGIWRLAIGLRTQVIYALSSVYRVFDRRELMMTSSTFRCHQPKRFFKRIGFALSVWLVLPGIAKADSIDGTWCSVREALMLTIQGSQLIVERSVSTGQYSRHNFIADWPVPSADHPENGTRIHLRLMGETTMVGVKIRANGETTAPETWHRCQPAT